MPDPRLLPCATHWGTHYTKGLWAHNPNLEKNYAALTWKIIIQLSHIFAHVMSAELSWNVQICDLIGLLEWELQCKQFFKDSIYELINSLWNGFQPYLYNQYCFAQFCTIWLGEKVIFQHYLKFLFLKTLKAEKNGCSLADNKFEYIFLNENYSD